MFNISENYLHTKSLNELILKKHKKYKQSKLGLPQGVTFSRILFNVYVNVLTEKVKNINNFKVSICDDVVIWFRQTTE